MDEPDADLPHVEHSINLTVEWCTHKCKTLGYRYAGLQKTNQCHCGNSFGKHGTANPWTCNMPCAGNANQTCGGAHWRMEIYLIG